MAAKSLLVKTLGVAVAITLFYFAVPVALIHWRLDSLIFSSQSHDTTHESQRYDIAIGHNANIIVRRYDGNGNTCAFFFPGQHGGIGTYERTLFPYLRANGVTVFSVSYPGQDGSGGQARPALLFDQTESAVRSSALAANCDLNQSIFIGRSLGATVALLEAERIRPAGIVVDGLGANLAVVIRAWIDRHALLRGWQLLPIQRFLDGHLYPVAPMLAHLTPIPIAVFQGTADDVTSFSAAQAVVQGHANVTFYPVPGGRHDDSYILARLEYLRVVDSMTLARRGIVERL